MMLTGTSATLLLANCKPSEVGGGYSMCVCGVGMCADFGCLNVEGQGAGTVAEGTIALIP